MTKRFDCLAGIRGFLVFIAILSAISLSLFAETSPVVSDLTFESGIDPLAAHLDGKPPEILRELPAEGAVPGNITLRRIVFRSQDHAEIFAVIAAPKSSGPHPGMLVLHGGGGLAEVEKAMAWAQRGYVAVAPDLPGIAEPSKLTNTKGRFSTIKYGEQRWVATPDASASLIFDAVLSAMKSLYLLRAHADVDATRIGVVGVSWGGYMTTMVCGLAGDQVKAGFALYGCGFFDLGSQQKIESYHPKLPRTSLGRCDPAERLRWLNGLDAGRRAPGMKAAFFLAAASNDFFGYPAAAQATLDAIPCERNQLFAPNANHKLSVPGGDIAASTPATPFTPTAFQPYPTPEGAKANWTSMEVTYFDYHLNHNGQPFPKVAVEQSDELRLARFSVTAAHSLTKVEVYWAKANSDVKARVWNPVPAALNGKVYEAKLPPDASDWFALVSDDRPVTVSSDMIHLRLADPAGVLSPASDKP
jgi:dienelactone hydrolase